MLGVSSEITCRMFYIARMYNLKRMQTSLKCPDVQEKITSEVLDWLKSSHTSRRSLASALDISASLITKKLSGDRSWTVIDVDQLEELGVLRIEVCAA